MARSMAQMQALLESMSPEQRRQLQELAEALLDDMDLRWQLDDLAHRLQGAFPGMGWDRRYDFSGADPLALAGAPGVLERLGDLDELENLLRSATSPAQLAEADIDRARERLADDAAQSLEELAHLARLLEEAGLIEQREGRYELTPRGLRRIGQRALSDLFARLAKDRLGRHETDPTGVGHERAYETKAYEFGDPFNLNIERTVRNALQRSGGGTPPGLAPGDLQGGKTETPTPTSTPPLAHLSPSLALADTVPS